jgi:hypothetical protein
MSGESGTRDFATGTHRDRWEICEQIVTTAIADRGTALYWMAVRVLYASEIATDGPQTGRFLAALLGADYAPRALEAAASPWPRHQAGFLANRLTAGHQGHANSCSI